MKNFEEVEKEKTLDLKKFFYRALRYWYFFPIFLILAVLISVALYQTTTPMHLISMQLLISEGQEATGRVDVGDRALPGVSLGGQSFIENQTIILTSRKQVDKTLKQLDFEISYFEKEAFKTQEIYKKSPFRVIVDSSEVNPAGLSFEVEFLSKEKYRLSLVDGDFSKEFNLFERVTHPLFAFSIVPVLDNLPGSNYHEKTYRFTVNSMNSLVGYYQSRLFLDRAVFGSTIVEISIMENNVQKGVDFLNKLAQNSVNYTLERKNHIALNTIDFIEKQLVGVADSLGAAENVLENFRSVNEVMDVSYQGQMILTQSKELEDQKSALLAKLDYYSYLNDYIESNRDMQEVIVPTSMGIEDPVLGQLIGQLSTLNAERSALRFNATTENPNITRMNASIENLKNNILESLKSVISATHLSLDDTNRRLYSLTGQIRNLPRTEQRLLNIERSRQMNNETYTFLLTKLTEAQLAKAANRPDNEIVDEARSMGMVVPDMKRSVMLVLLLGLFLPAVIIFIKIFTNDKVLETDDVKEFSALPIIGEVPYEKRNGKSSLIETATAANTNTILAESFRSIRTSLGYYANQKASKTVLITSTLPGEGKSFCAINLARSFAQLNKKTLLIEFDMRRPSLSKQSGITANGNGLSSYYTGDAKVDDIINTDSEIENLHIIFAGHIPPNPSELIAGDITKRLMDELQGKYEMIVIDTPPVGVVADAHLLTEYADVNIVVVRHNKTPKPVLKMNLRDEKVKNIPHLSILMNGIPFQRREYSYKYGYDVNSKYFSKN